MASDLDVTTATWGTADLLPATGDIGEAVDYAQQVSKNTGWNFYRPQMVGQMDDPIELENGASQTETYYRYMAAGSYMGYAKAYLNLGAADDSGTVTLDGTTLLVDTGALTAYVDGSASVIISSDAWVAITYTVDTAALSIGTMTRAFVATRQTG